MSDKVSKSHEFVIVDCDDDVDDDAIDAEVDRDGVDEETVDDDKVIEARFEMDGATSRRSRTWSMAICLRGIKWRYAGRWLV